MPRGKLKPKSYTKEKIKEMYLADASLAQIISTLKTARPTIVKYLKEDGIIFINKRKELMEKKRIDIFLKTDLIIKLLNHNHYMTKIANWSGLQLQDISKIAKENNIKPTNAYDKKITKKRIKEGKILLQEQKIDRMHLTKQKIQLKLLKEKQYTVGQMAKIMKVSRHSIYNWSKMMTAQENL